jgi:ribosomal 30S subunit maturation factor RimM
LRLEPGSYYVVDLLGCMVLSHGSHVGSVTGVQFGAGEAPLLIVGSQEKREFLVPLAQEFLIAVDLKQRQIEMALPENLLDLDAPLTDEEKRAQRETKHGVRSR